MFFFRKSNSVEPDISTILYSQIVEMARRTKFYSDYGVPDTLDGRFDVLSLHMFLLMRRLKDEGTRESHSLSQSLFDLMFKDMDAILRQIGVSDLKVGKEVKAMAKAFLGRVDAYDAALESAKPVLEDCIQRNVFRSETKVLAAQSIADYMHVSHIALKAISEQEIRQGKLVFPDLDFIENQA